MSPTYEADMAQYGSQDRQQFRPNDNSLPQAFVPNMTPALESDDLPVHLSANDAFDPSLQPLAPSFEPSPSHAVDGDHSGEGSPRKRLVTRKPEKNIPAQNEEANRLTTMEDLAKKEVKTSRISNNRAPGRPLGARSAPEPKVVEDIEGSHVSDKNIHSAKLAKQQDRRRLATRATKDVGKFDLRGVEENSPIAEENFKKRGRGRPPKVRPTFAEDQSQIQIYGDTRERRRGRMSEAILEREEEAESEELPRKRGPGRPRKSHNSPIANDKIAAVEVGEGMNDDIKPVEGHTKRRSLRNRQNDMSSNQKAEFPVNDSDQFQIDEVPKKRGPGRPRKYVGDVPVAPVLKASTLDRKIMRTIPETSIKRRPGRPPKKRRGRTFQTQPFNNADNDDIDVSKTLTSDKRTLDDYTIVALPVGYSFEDFIKTNHTSRKAGIIALGQVQQDGVGNIRRLIQALSREEEDDDV